MLEMVIGLVGIIGTVAAAGFWLYASMIPVPNNIETFIEDLQRISRMNAYGAMAAGIAAICATFQLAWHLGWL